MQPTSDCNLLTLPEELLIQHILARLDLPTLKSCLSTCRWLSNTIKSSAFLKYAIALQEMSLIENPAVSYDEIPINKRLEMLREYRERMGIRWKTSAKLLPRSFSYLRSIRVEAGLLYDRPCFELERQELQWTSLPWKEDQPIKWNTFCLSNPSAIVGAHALSVEKNDLLAFVTWNRPLDAENSLQIQIHLVQHSIQLPYPGLSSPTFDVCAFKYCEDDCPVVTLAIRGANLAVMVGHSIRQPSRDSSTWTGHLSVWNWETGEKVCEKLNIPDRIGGLVFLREDILLHGSPPNMALDIYHIPTTTPSASDCELRLIERLAFPRVKTESYNDPLFNFIMSFADNPGAIPSFTESSDPKVTRLFTADNLSSVLAIEITMEDSDGWTPFLFITHHHTLLGRADHALSRSRDGENTVARLVEWERWGPEVTRILWYEHEAHYRTPHNATCGSRVFRQSSNSIEVYDFSRAGTNNGIQNPRQVLSLKEEYWREWFQEVVHTRLPFAYQIFEGSIDGVDIKDWDAMYVDQSRIIGVLSKSERIDVLYIG